MSKKAKKGGTAKFTSAASKRRAIELHRHKVAEANKEAIEEDIPVDLGEDNTDEDLPVSPDPAAKDAAPEEDAPAPTPEKEKAAPKKSTTKKK